MWQDTNVILGLLYFVYVIVNWEECDFNLHYWQIIIANILPKENVNCGHLSVYQVRRLVALIAEKRSVKNTWFKEP